MSDIGFDFKDVKKAVQADLNKERIDKAKVKYKAQLTKVEQAKQILRNEERALEALEHELSEGVGS